MATFPNHPPKITGDPVVSSSRFLDYMRAEGRFTEGKIPEGVIFCYQSSLWRYIKENHKTSPAGGTVSELLLLDETDGKVGVIGGFGIGAPIAALLLEDLIAHGVTRFISMGTAGSLQKDLDIGDVVVCEKAIRDEGVSHHYIPSEKYASASEAMTQRICQTLSSLNIDYRKGSAWTTDAPYRETKEEVKAYQDEGVSVVEMEAAALFAVAEFRKVPLGSVITISDSLADLCWNPHFYSKPTSSSLEKLFQVSIKSLLEPLA